MKVAKKFRAIPAGLLMLASHWVLAAAPEAKLADLVDVQSATCAQFAKTLNYAKPPTKPTKKQEALATLAQDDLLLALTWIHGYQSGKEGGKSNQAFDKEWIVSTMGKLTESCKGSPGGTLIKEVAAKL